MSADLWDYVGKFGWLLSTVLTLFLGWAGWSLRQRFAMRDDIDKLDSKIDGMSVGLDRQHRETESRVSKLEMQAAKWPTADDLQKQLSQLETRLSERTSRIEAHMDGMSDKLDTTNALITDLLQKLAAATVDRIAK
jgi:uncharacterized coiled-coil protein SlyX